MRTIILDFETCAIDAAEQFVELPAAPANYKDPEKIAAYVKEKRQETIERAALDLDLARIACIGYDDPNEPDSLLIRSFTSEAEERAGVSWLLNLVSDARIITFNGLKYDLPLLQRRAAYLGLPTWRPNLDRYRTPHIDLWQMLSHNGAVTAHSLSWYVKRHGWTDLQAVIPSSAVPAAIAANEWPQVEDHCRADILATKRLAAWLGVAW